jgi:hypothetical protein
VYNSYNNIATIIFETILLHFAILFLHYCNTTSRSSTAN